MFRFLVFAVVIRSSVAVIYKLNETDYYKMPLLYALDDFATCMADPAGTYCLADFALQPDGSDLYNMIKGYSDYSLKHFNHTQLHRGICVTRTCKKFYRSKNITGLSQTLEACFNESIWRDYKLHAKVDNIQYCKRADDRMTLDNYDVAIAIVYLIIILFNIIGSGYDMLWEKRNEKAGDPYLLAFSVRRNWKKLVAPCGKATEPRLERLRVFHGLRTATMVCVFFSHTVLIMAYSFVDNPLYIETAYEDPTKQILFNGSLVTHTFFVMSSFLLSYNLMVYSEKHTISWLDWPKGMFLRWLRLVPAYALVIATISTWSRHLGSGPVWDMVVTSEADACRQYWWTHLLFINNYVFTNSYCLPQTWYLAADTQLFAFGLLLCIAFRSKKARVYALAVCFLVSIVIVVLCTYFQDLDAVVIQSPETYRQLYAKDETFRTMYILGHTNLSTYIMGLTGGFLTYHWQKQKKDFSSLKRHRWFVWALFPIALGVLMSGGLFYMDGPRVSIGYRTIYAAIYKPVFQLLVTLFILSCIFKLESLYRGIMEWRGFTWSGRVSYGAFLLHTLFQRGLIGGQARPTYLSDYYVLVILTATALLSFAGAAVLFLMVEAPAGGLMKTLFSPDKHKPDADGARTEDRNGAGHA